MNIFKIESTFKESAKSLDNKRINKMAVETGQLLSTALNLKSRKDFSGLIYKSTHINHPCSIWARSNINNWFELREYLSFLINEIVIRYKKEPRVNDLYRVLLDKEIENSWDIESDYSMELPLCMPDEYKLSGIVESYRNYYANKDNLYYFEYDIPDWISSYIKSDKLISVKYTDNKKYSKLLIKKKIK